MRLFFCCLFVFACTCVRAQEEIPQESDYYAIATLPMPEGVVLEVGGMVTLPNGSLAVSTRRGEVYIVDNPYLRNGRPPSFRKFAEGLHEILGLAYYKNELYCAQRTELTKLVDNDGDGRADLYETIQTWPVTGHYHGYAFGPKVDGEGKMYVTLNVHFDDQEWWRGIAKAPWRGWTLRIDPETKTKEPYATGMRSPAGIGIIDGQFFYADNQGDWMGSGGLVHVEKGDFTGHPAGLAWASLEESPVQIDENDVYYRVSPRFTPEGKPPVKPENIEDEKPYAFKDLAAELDAVKTPAVWLPHSILGISTSEIIVDSTEGAFGPFAGQVFIGDQGQSKIMRVNLEKVNGVYQGAAFNFREGFQSGVLRMAWGKDGSLFVGETNRGWGSAGTEPYGLERLVWTGKTPFEIHSIRAEADGFTLRFTQPVDKETAREPASYAVNGFLYKYHPVYGSPLVERMKHPIPYAEVSDDGLEVRLKVDSLRRKYIHEVAAVGVRSYAGGHPLLHDRGYYTLNEIPDRDTLAIPETFLAERERRREAAAKLAEAERVLAEAEAKAKEATVEAEVARQPSPGGGSRQTGRPRAETRLTTPPPARLTSTASNNTMPPSWNGKADETISMSTRPGLKFSRNSITLKAGSRVQLTFANSDDMPHNLVVTMPRKMAAVGQAAMKMGLDGAEKDYIPDMPDAVIAHTALVGPGGKQTIYFEVPEKPGLYNYVCTFPGHWRAMNGEMLVVP